MRTTPGSSGAFLGPTARNWFGSLRLTAGGHPNSRRRSACDAMRPELRTTSSRVKRDRLPAPLVHQDGGAEGVQCVLEECEVVGAPEQRTALHHHSLDRRTSCATVTQVSGCQGSGRFLVE